MKKVIKYTACSAPRCQCPEIIIDFENNECQIRDDYGSTIRVSIQEMELLMREFIKHV